MWVFEEKLPSGEKLTDVISKTNENVKYLPGIKLGKNVVAVPDLENAGMYNYKACFRCIYKDRMSAILRKFS
ncbi:hypothetical protein JHK87_044421 [Glycine soja]|nr:hypothetical protein JHK87_044421 [Glycine soja]